jgi:spore maturation protein CgeB
LRFCIFGLTLSSAWGNGHATPYRALLRALHRRGHDITFFEKDVPYYALRRDFAECDYCDLRLYPSWDQVRHAALECASESDIAMVASYCPEGARINDEVLALNGPLHVFYDLDTPVTLAQLERGAAEYLWPHQISEFDLVLSFTGGKALETLKNTYGARKVFPLYGCVDPDLHARAERRREFICDLSYMATYALDRQEKVDDLFLGPARRMPDRKFLLAGTQYPSNWKWPENVQRFDHVAPGDHPSLYSSSRCTLNITRGVMAANGYCPSGRFFEAAACGTPILTDGWEGMEEFFEPDEELFVVSGTEDVISALRRDRDELLSIACRARERTLDEHTCDCRAERLLSYIQAAQCAYASTAQEAA